MFWIVLFWVLAIVLSVGVLVQVGYVGRGREVPVVTSMRRLLERDAETDRRGTADRGR